MLLLNPLTRSLYRPLNHVTSSCFTSIQPSHRKKSSGSRMVCSERPFETSVTICPKHAKWLRQLQNNQISGFYGMSVRHTMSSSSSPEPQVREDPVEVSPTNKPPGHSFRFTPILFEATKKSTLIPSQRINEATVASHEADSIRLSDEPILVWKSISNESVSDYSIYYLRLSKFRLTSLVVATTLAGFAMGCQGWSMDPTLLAATLVGTGLTSASAASLNQFLEVPFDSQMFRTRSRPLVVGQLTSFHAFNFALVTGVAGLSLLFFQVNPLTGLLGVTNLLLYSFIYTPLKRMNIVNTWIGSFVGAIPPVMGFTAVTGMIDLSGLLLGAILYSWQFPHFNALSWNLRHDYARAGFRMMSVTDPELCLKTQLRHSLYLTSYCLLMSHPSIGLTTWTFAVDTLPFNLYLVYLSYKFKSDPGSASSRKLFRYSLIHLPAIILLMIISKNVRKEEVKSKELLNEKNLSID